jgi:N-methylhydantoinase B
VSIGAGGGGYGPPRERNPEAVADAVREGLLSRGRAEAVYGVVIDRNGAADLTATRLRRANAALGPAAGRDARSPAASHS